MKNEINTYKANIDSNEQSIELSNSLSKSYTLDSNTYKNNEITQVQTSIKQLEDQKKEYSTQLKNYELQKKDYVIKAEMDGYVHFIHSINEKEVLQAGQQVIKINTDKGDFLKVQLYIPSTEISNIKEGQNVKLHSYSLPYREYGFIESKIENLDIDASIMQDNQGSYYKAEMLIENIVLENSNGQKAYLKTGMPIEGQIITSRKSYLQLFLEKLDLWING